MPWLRRSVAAAAWVAVGLAVVTAGGAGRLVAATGRRGPCAPGVRARAVPDAQGIGSLQHLTYGVPAVHRRAVRAGRAPAVRGPPRALRAAARPPARAGSCAGFFERRADWNVAVTVEIHAAGALDQVAGRATAVGGKDALPATAVQAAIDVFSALPGVAFDAAALARVRAPISHDAYAFVLYGRGVGAFHGGGGGPARAELAAGLSAARAAGRAHGPRDPPFPGPRAAGDREAATGPRHADLRARQASGLPAGAAQPGRGGPWRGRDGRPRSLRQARPAGPGRHRRAPRLWRAAATSQPAARSATRARGGSGGHPRRRAGAPAAGDGPVVAARRDRRWRPSWKRR